MTLTFECVYAGDSKSLGGLAWAGSAMLFADIEASVIRRFDPQSGQVDVVRSYTNRTHGIGFGPDGELFAAQQGGRRVVRLMPDGSALPTCSELDGRYQNHPTFLAVDPAGQVWISDCFSDQPAAGPQIFPLQDSESVLRLKRSPDDPQGWILERMAADIGSVRGIAVSRRGDSLYIADADEGAGVSQICAYRIHPGAGLGAKSVLCRIEGAVNGLCTAAGDRVLACVGERPGLAAAIAVFDTTGVRQDEWSLPGATPVQCAFGGADDSVLYVTTAQGMLLRARSVGK